MFELVGSVAGIYRFPVKSMRGHEVASANVTWQGIEGDRRYAFVNTGNTTLFPWLTARQAAGILLYEPFFAEPERPAYSPVLVRTPSGADMPVEDEALRAAMSAIGGRAIHLEQSLRGLPDIAPLSLISTGTVREAARETGVAPDATRFRMNLVVETLSGKPFEEDTWLGRAVRFGAEGGGGAIIRPSHPDSRCVMTNLDPDTGAAEKRVHAWIGAARGGALGVYAMAERLGIVKAGDPVFVERD